MFNGRGSVYYAKNNVKSLVESKSVQVRVMDAEITFVRPEFVSHCFSPKNFAKNAPDVLNKAKFSCLWPKMLEDAISLIISDIQSKSLLLSNAHLKI